MLIPRHAGDINVDTDLATPERAKRCLDIAKQTIFKQKREINTLQQKTRRLCKKIEALEDKVRQLQNQNIQNEGTLGDAVALDTSEDQLTSEFIIKSEVDEEGNTEKYL